MVEAFAVFDTKAAAYGMPMFMSNQGLAIRGFSDACADQQSTLYLHPEDYNLYHIGSYDPNTGIMTPLEKHEHICSASAVVALLRPAAPGAPVPSALKKVDA